MIKNLVITAALIISTFFSAFAEEGMLIPSLIKAFENDMQAMGMKLTAEEIYSINQSSLKDAIFHFGGGCTSEFVSAQGLMLTNHHCGYSQIQAHSSLENDYLKYGFWAKTKKEELKNPGLTATRVVKIVDVTKLVFEGTANANEQQKDSIFSVNIKAIVKKTTADNHYEAKIRAFDYGNSYYMIVEEVFKDVRLVGTPPNSIGKFGGDTDNWVWPRHTGDFSVFRVYANKDNEPSEISDDNVPYQPLHFLPISMKDRTPGDFTMVFGFPGRTEQHLSSANLKFIIEKERPARIKMREKSLGVIDAGMRSSDLIRIKYSSKQARIANGWKKWIGQIGGLKTVNAVQIKLDREEKYNTQAATNEEWNKKYGNITTEMNSLIQKSENQVFAYSMDIEYLYVGPELFKQARGLNKLLANYLSLKEKGTLTAAIEKEVENAKLFYKNYDAETDKEIFVLLTEEYIKQTGEANFTQFLKGKTIQELANDIYDKSFLTNEARYMKFMSKLSEKSLATLKKKDKGFMVWNATNTNFIQNIVPAYYTYSDNMDALIKTFIAGKLEMFPNAKHWPDANGTMRITYGKLEGSAPHDGMKYIEHTTIEGMVPKNNSGKYDYEMSDRMKELIKKKDYGNYTQDGELWVCFTGSNHTTGGNSGSPVLDAEGNLMGLNFDRSWESTMSDFMFDSKRCRNIAVDIRYVLWVMDVYAGAGHLVKEMTLVK